MEKDKKYNVVLGLMIFFFILFVGVCIAFGLGVITINNESSDVDSQVNQNNLETQTSIKETNEVIVSQTNTNKESTPKKEETKTLLNNASLLEISDKKCLNDSYGRTYKYQIIDGISGVSAWHYDDKLTIIVEEGSFSQTFESQIKIDLNTEYEIKNINLDDVAEISFNRYGFENIGMFFLMKDGTVKWLNVEEACSNNKFNVSETIKGVSDVVRISSAVSGAESGSATTVIGMKSDGNFYDLMDIVLEK